MIRMISRSHRLMNLIKMFDTWIVVWFVSYIEFVVLNGQRKFATGIKIIHIDHIQNSSLIDFNFKILHTNRSCMYCCTVYFSVYNCVYKSVYKFYFEWLQNQMHLILWQKKWLHLNIVDINVWMRSPILGFCFGQKWQAIAIQMQYNDTEKI